MEIRKMFDKAARTLVCHADFCRFVPNDIQILDLLMLVAR